jgi:hypothetical protein
MGFLNFVGGVHQTLEARPFIRMNYNTSKRGTGYPSFIYYKQLVLEASLPSVMSATDHSILRVGSTLTSVSEDAEYVYMTYDY